MPVRTALFGLSIRRIQLLDGGYMYTHKSIHTELFGVTSDLSGPFLMTYDDSLEIRELAAKHGFHVREVAMKNSHHAVMKELLISSDFGWLHD